MTNALNAVQDIGWVNQQGRALPARISPLELLHPRGLARRPLVLGGNCPRRLLPDPRQLDDQAADLIIVAPTPAECRSPGWFDHTVDRILGELAPDGQVYALIPTRWRRRFRRVLRRHGFMVESAWSHRPDQTNSRFLVPIELLTNPYAFATLRPMPPKRRRMIDVALRLPGGPTLLADSLPAVGLALRRSTTTPSLGWFPDLRSGLVRSNTAIFKLRSLERTQIATLACFSSTSGRPITFAKVGLTKISATECAAEFENLRELGPAVESAGARVPVVHLTRATPGYPVVTLSLLSGTPVSTLLRLGQRSPEAIMSSMTDWLISWNRSTLSLQPLGFPGLEREILAPASALAHNLDGSDQYLGWLTERCADVTGRMAPTVATHNDLGMENVLLHPDGNIGIIDWPDARSNDLPLLDYFFAMASVLVSTHNFEAWPQAVRNCFGPGGEYVPLLAQQTRRISHAIGVSEDLIDLCFHACWLRRAFNESRLPSDGRPRPFHEIVQRLAIDTPA